MDTKTGCAGAAALRTPVINNVKYEDYKGSNTVALYDDL